MMRCLDHGWRLFATGWLLAVFGLAGLVLGITAFPLITLFTPDLERRHRRAQRLLHEALSFFLWWGTAMGLLTYEVRGRHWLRRGQLVVANHPSLIDVIFLLAFLPEADCIAKGKLFRNPCTGPAMRAAGYIDNSAGPRQVIGDAVAALTSRQRSLIVFPEGTRSVGGQPLKLSRGAAQIALRARAEVLPVTIRCSPAVLIKDQKWWQIPPQRPHYSFILHAPLQGRAFLHDGCSQAGAARELTHVLLRYFTDSADAAAVPVPAAAQAA
jgi:1-acyl-sn-glycerol-3-phosphate acyltransferase